MVASSKAGKSQRGRTGNVLQNTQNITPLTTNTNKTVGPMKRPKDEAMVVPENNSSGNETSFFLDEEEDNAENTTLALSPENKNQTALNPHDSTTTTSTSSPSSSSKKTKKAKAQSEGVRVIEEGNYNT